MDYAALQTGLPVLIQALFGATVKAVQWGDQPVQFAQGTSATLDILTPEAIGVDDRQWADVGAPATAVQETVTGARELIVQVTVTSQSQKLDESARAHLERLRARLRWTTSIGTLAGLGLALLEIGPLIEFDTVENGRLISKSAIEIRCGYIHSETDAETPFIETARVSSDLDNAAGDPLPAGMQFDIEVPTP